MLQVDRDSQEGRELGRVYHVEAYPYVSFVDGITGECVWSRSFPNKASIPSDEFVKASK